MRTVVHGTIILCSILAATIVTLVGVRAGHDGTLVVGAVAAFMALAGYEGKAFKDSITPKKQE